MDFKYPKAHEIVSEYLRQVDCGAKITPEDVIAQHKALEYDLRKEFRNLRMIENVVGGTPADAKSTPKLVNGSARSNGTAVSSKLRCPHCHQPTELTLEGSFRAVECHACGQTFSLIKDRKWPSHIAHFELIKRIGIGGFGTVWKARDTKLDRFVAVKLPRRTFLEDSEAEQFFREAKTAANLSHKNIVRVLDVGMHDGSIYIASELIEGKSLDQHIKQGVTQKTALNLTETIARALHYAHEHDVIHRDLKPQNVMVDGNGTPFLSDFGLARRADKDLTLTMSGQVLGTPGYMSPEQARGESHSADARSDVYSLGAMLYELLTGQVPFQGNPLTVFQRVQQEDPANPRKLNHQVSLDAATVCMKCLEKDPDKRYQSADDVADELRRISTGQPIEARPVGIAGRSARWVKRNPTTAFLAAGLLLAFFAASVLFVIYYAQLEIGEIQARQSLLTSIRNIRTKGENGYGEEIKRQISANKRLVADKRLNAAFRHEWLQCLGDFTALPPRGADFQGMNLTNATISKDGTTVALAFRKKEGDRQRDWIEVRSVNQLDNQSHNHASVDAEVIASSFGPGESELVTFDKLGVVTRFAITANELQPMSKKTIWDAQDGELIGRFTPDGSKLALADQKTVGLYDIAKGELTFNEPTDISEGARCIAVSADAKRIVIGYCSELGSTGGAIRWDLSDASHKATELYNKGSLYENSIAFNKDGTRIALGGMQTTLLDSDDLIQRSFFLDSVPHALAFCSKSHYLAIGYIGYTEIRNHKTNELVGKLETSPDWYGIGTVFSEDSETILTWNRDCIRVLDLGSDTERARIDEHAAGIPCLRFNGDGSTLISASADGSVRFWNTAEERVSQQAPPIMFNGQVQCLALHGSLLAVAEWQEPSVNPKEALTIRKMASDFSSYEQRLAIPNDLGDICGLGFSADGQYLAASGSNGIRVWKLSQHQGQVSCELFWSPPKTENGGAEQETMSDDKYLVFAPQGNRLFHANNWGFRVMSVDLDESPPSHVHLGKPEAQGDMLLGWHGLAFVGENELAFVGPERSLEIWDVRDMSHGGQPVLTSPAGLFSDSHIAVSSHGLVAGLSSAKVVSIWDPKTQQIIYTLPSESSTIYSLAWTPDGRHLAIGLANGRISIWDLDAVDAQLELLGFATRAR